MQVYVVVLSYLRITKDNPHMDWDTHDLGCLYGMNSHFTKISSPFPPITLGFSSMNLSRNFCALFYACSLYLTGCGTTLI